MGEGDRSDECDVAGGDGLVIRQLSHWSRYFIHCYSKKGSDMAYSNFTRVLPLFKQFGLKHDRFNFPVDIADIEPSVWLRETIETGMKTSLISEKERSEKVVNPILLELTKINDYQLTVYSGRELNIDPQVGLNGECDFLLSWSTLHEEVEAPVFSVVEAKKNDLDLGVSQCFAQMIGAKKFNELNGISMLRLYGASTNGFEWRFLKLEADTAYLNYESYHVTKLDELLGTLQFIVDDCRVLKPAIA